MKVLRGLNVLTGSPAPSPGLAGGGRIVNDDSLLFAGLGFSHLVLKKRCEEPWTRKGRSEWGGVERRGERVQAPPPAEWDAFGHLMYQAL